jgi:pimeloyl-ACP methyl ester carboxylesterase
MKILKWVGIALAVLILVLMVGPFLVPVPPLQNAKSPQDLADPDSHFIEINGLNVHYKIAGQGEPTIILLHGFGASTYSWREVMQPLAEIGTVVAYDRPAFGLTQRPIPGEWSGQSPYGIDANAEMLIGLMDTLGIEKAILIGNSAGGTVAAYSALKYPDRVQALILVDAAIYTGSGLPGLIQPLLSTPQMRHIGPLIARNIEKWGDDFLNTAWHNPSLITPEIRAGYHKPLQIRNWDRALWEFTAAARNPHIVERLSDLKLPVLVITGDDDRIVPTQESIRLGQAIAGAQLVVIPDSGHVPQEETPQAFLEAVDAFITGLQ